MNFATCDLTSLNFWARTSIMDNTVACFFHPNDPNATRGNKVTRPCFISILEDTPPSPSLPYQSIQWVSHFSSMNFLKKEPCMQGATLHLLQISKEYWQTIFALAFIYTPLCLQSCKKPATLLRCFTYLRCFRCSVKANLPCILPRLRFDTKLHTQITILAPTLKVQLVTVLFHPYHW